MDVPIWHQNGRVHMLESSTSPCLIFGGSSDPRAFVLPPPGEDDFCFWLAVVPGDTNEVGRTSWKHTTHVHCPGITRRFYHFFGPLSGGGARTGASTENIYGTP